MTNDLRKQAEAKLALSPEPLTVNSPEETGRLLHELRVHQIELELQNEELRTAQAEMEASQARYFDLYELAPAGYVTVGEKELVMEANLAAAALLGVNRDALARQPLTRFILREDQDLYYLLRQRFSDIPADGTLLGQGSGGQTEPAGALQRCELRMVKPDGEHFWAQLNATITNGLGSAPACRIILSDLTERKRAEEALRESRGEFADLLANLPGMAYRCANSAEWAMLFVSEGCLPLTGYTLGELTGAQALPYAQIIHPEDRCYVREQVEAAMRTGTRFEIKYRIIAKDGTVKWVWERGSEPLDDKGSHSHIEGFISDITERKRDEEALRESEMRFKALHNASFGGIAIHDKGLILECNLGLSEITGYTYDELIGMDGLSLISNDTRETVVRNIDAGHEQPYEVKGVRKNGEIYPVRLEAKNIRYKDNDVRVVEFRDITERKRAEAELLQKAEELRSRNEELERFNNLTVGRELRMIELKAEINALLKTVGEPEKYKIFGDET